MQRPTRYNKCGAIVRQGGLAGVAAFVLRFFQAGFGLGPQLGGVRQPDAAMNEIARQLRAQIRSSTDPQWLERMAREAERRVHDHQP
jgi:hypothetical protein